MKAGMLRVCTPGDYKPFSFQKPDGSYEGIDVDLVHSARQGARREPEFVKTQLAER